MTHAVRSPDLAVALRGFFSEYLPKLRGDSPHTICSYRDSLKRLLLFLTNGTRRVERLTFGDMAPERIIAFLDHLEQERGNTVGTRNNRLAAIHSFFRHVASVFPQHLQLAQQVLSIPIKRTRTREVEYLQFEEIKAVLNEADLSTSWGRRDHALLILMFNTGGRVQEIVDIRASDLSLAAPCAVRFFGKGRKERTCPIWSGTAQELFRYLHERGIDPRAHTPVFTNQRGLPLSRFGVRYILAKYTRKAAAKDPRLAAKRLHPHSMRHSTAIHLLKAGVDLTSIANWLGHASPNTTNRYATIDVDMKRTVLAKAEPIAAATPHWRQDKDLLSWLESL